MINNKALVVIDIQNDITKHYRDIIGNINAAIEWAVAEGMPVVYIKHNNITAATRTFKPGSKGEELVPEMKVVSDNIFVKTKSNALTSEAFSAFIAANGINEFYVAGADATACVPASAMCSSVAYRIWLTIVVSSTLCRKHEAVATAWTSLSFTPSTPRRVSIREQVPVKPSSSE